MHDPALYYPSYPRTQILYGSICAFTILFLISLPFIQIDISVNSPGLIRPLVSPVTIRNIVPGRVQESFISENKKVKKGSPLCILSSDLLQERQHHLARMIEDKTMSQRDIADLLTFTPKEVTAQFYQQRIITLILRTSLYRQNFEKYRKHVSELCASYQQAKVSYDRQLRLYREAVVATTEFESSEYELQKAESQLEEYLQYARTEWETAQESLSSEILDLQSEKTRVAQEAQELIIRAPIDGTLQNITGAYPGTLLSANQEIAQLSPDTSLHVLTYVSPSEIGFIRTGMPVRFQVMAYNHHQWGMATGNVKSISPDVAIIENQPRFIVYSSLDQQKLVLRNGYQGHLRKGMSLLVRFQVTRRTIWNLLFDKIDNWMNPHYSMKD